MSDRTEGWQSQVQNREPAASYYAKDEVLVGVDGGYYEGCIAHVTGVYFEADSETRDVLYRLWDRSHTTMTYMHQEDVRDQFKAVGLMTNRKPVQLVGVIRDSPDEIFSSRFQGMNSEEES